MWRRSPGSRRKVFQGSGSVLERREEIRLRGMPRVTGFSRESEIGESQCPHDPPVFGPGLSRSSSQSIQDHQKDQTGGQNHQNRQEEAVSHAQNTDDYSSSSQGKR